MRSGKKGAAQKQIYRSLKMVKTKTNQDPLMVFNKALENIKPLMEVRPRRVGGAAYQVPMPVRGDRRESLAIRWLIKAAASRPSREFHTFAEKLTAEILDAFNNTGGAVKKKDDTHRMAEANKTFAHFRW
jgi:small subunit ribosomal protein S7